MTGAAASSSYVQDEAELYNVNRSIQLLEERSSILDILMRNDVENHSDTNLGMVDRGICPYAHFFGPGQVLTRRAFQSNGEHHDTSDISGHGTLCASVLSSMMSERAKFGPLELGSITPGIPWPNVAIYKIASPDCLVQAVEAAINDGMQILSISMGQTSKIRQPFGDYLSWATFIARHSNILSCLAVGNGGEDTDMANTAPWQASLGSCRRKFKITTRLKCPGMSDIQGRSINISANTKSCPLIHIDNAKTAGILDNEKAKGKILVLESYGKVDVDTNAKGAMEAGAAGIIVVNAGNRPLTSFLYPIAAISVDEKDGNKIYRYMEKHGDKALATIETSQLRSEGVWFPVLADHTSRVHLPSSAFFNQPDMFYDGEEVVLGVRQEAGIPAGKQRYGVSDGTSFANAGASSLFAALKHRCPDMTPEQMRSAFMTTCIPPKIIRREEALATGSGYPDLPAAEDPGAFYDIEFEDYCKFIRGLKVCDERMLDLVRSLSKTTGAISGRDLNYPSFRAPIPHDDMTVVYTRTLTYIGGKNSETFTANLISEKGLHLEVDLPKIRFTRPRQKISFKLTVRVSKWGSNKFLVGQIIWESKFHAIRSPIIAVREEPPEENICLRKPVPAAAASAKREVVREKAPQGKVQKKVGVRLREDLPPAKRAKVQKNEGFLSSEDLPAAKRGTFHMNLRSNKDLPAAKRGNFHMNLRSNEDLPAAKRETRCIRM